MPPADALYLLGYLFEIGPTVPAGMGDGPVSHGEIESWQRNTGIELSAWECRMLKRLSADYAAQRQAATARDCQTPWGECPYRKSTLLLASSERTRDAIRGLANL